MSKTPPRRARAAAMSSTPPRPTAGSCARSPTRATVAPASSATVSSASAVSWSSIPASSTTIRSPRASRAHWRPGVCAAASASGSPRARRVHTPSLFHRHPCAWTSLATTRRHAEFSGGDVGGLLRWRHDPGPRPSAAAVSIATASIVVLPAPAAPSTTTSGSVEATAAAARACPGPGPARRRASSRRAPRCSRWWPRRGEHVAQPRLDGDDVQAGQVRDVLGLRRAGRQHRQAIPDGEPVASAMRSRNAAGSARTPDSVMIRVTCSCIVCPVQVDAAAAQRSSARDATGCTSGRPARSAARDGRHPPVAAV